GSEDQDILRGAQCCLANRGIGGTQVAEAGCIGEAQTVRKAYQVVHMRSHVLAVARIRVAFENLLRAWAEPKVAGEGIGIAPRRVALAAVTAFAAADARVYVDAVARLERADARTHGR